MNKSVVSLVVVFVAGIVLGQGSLEPSSAPAETMKTLQQVEPRIDIATVAGDVDHKHKILSSGSYYLSGEMDSLVQAAIVVLADNVVIDLNGFTINGNAAGGGFVISVSTAAKSLTIRNGVIKNASRAISSSLGAAVKVENITILGCTSYGIYLGSGAVISDCIVADCGSIGILVGDESSVLDCSVFGSGGNGISIGSGAVLDCTVFDNGGNGISVGNGSLVSRCVSYSNDTHGVFAKTGSRVFDCTAYDNLGSGIYVLDGSMVGDCTSYGNKGHYGIKGEKGTTISGCTADYNDSQYGIYVTYNSQIKDCTASYNTGAETTSYGIYASPGSSVINCVAGNNYNTNSPSTGEQGGGIYAHTATVKGCTTTYNQGDGIRVISNSYISDNQCRSNGRDGDGTGIHVTGVNNRIEGNNLIDNDRGLEVDDAGNFIVKNTASDNTTNYVIIAGNNVGTINTNPVAAAAWDNFEF